MRRNPETIHLTSLQKATTYKITLLLHGRTFCAATWGQHMSVKQYRNVGNSITQWGLLSPAVSETLQTPAAKSTRPNTFFRQPASGTTFTMGYLLSASFFMCNQFWISTIKNTLNMIASNLQWCHSYNSTMKTNLVTSILFLGGIKHRS